MSRPPRFFISPDRVSGSRITVTDEDVRHIATVLRMKTGDLLLLCDGQGTEYTVRIAEISRARIETDIVSRLKQESRLPRITLGQGLPKSDKMDWIAQKATELGVSAIAPLVTERTIVKIRDEQKRLARWQKIAKEAAMQSNRPDIPKIEGLRRYREFIDSPLNPPSPPLLKGGALSPPPLEKGDRGGFLNQDTLLLLPWEEGTTPIKDVLRRNAGARNIVVLIGPEGGFSGAEAEAAKGRGFHLVSLGPHILRTETAAIAALSMIGYEYY